jgi:hypothetical protein
MVDLPHSSSDAVWVCACGQVYHMSGDAPGMRFWPSAGNAPYSRRGLTAASPCVRCGARIRGKALHPVAAAG